jgi:hypothetical protein
MPTNGKLGKKLGKVLDPRTFQLREFLPRTAISEIKIPKAWRIGGLRHEVPMFANDDYGCCTLASTGHGIIVQEAAVGQRTEIKLTDVDILAAYSAITGFDPNRPETDNGAYMLDVANYRRKVGIGKEKDGTTHTVEAFIEVNRADLAQVRAGTVLFGGLWLGVWLPNSAKHQTVWDVPPEGPHGEGEPGSWGGHAVQAVGYDANQVTIYTWGREQQLTWNFFNAYVDEAYVFVTEDYLRRGSKTTPRGFDVTRLEGYLAEIKK